jgi:hypothetical protein
VTIVKLPSTLPAAVAANCTAKLVLSPGERAFGTVNPVRLKPFPTILAWLMPTPFAAVLVRVKICEFLEPTAALTERLLGEAES